MPRPLLGLSGPVARAISLNLAPALAWGVGRRPLRPGVRRRGAGLHGAAAGLARSSSSCCETVFPGVDYASAGGFLQLLFVELGVILAGLAAATFVGGWASDETSGRLEMVLATPLSRVRWAIAGGDRHARQRGGLRRRSPRPGSPSASRPAAATSPRRSPAR